MKKQGTQISFLLLMAVLSVGCGLWMSGLGCSSKESASAPTTVVLAAPTSTPVCASPSSQGVTTTGTLSNEYNADQLTGQPVTLTVSSSVVSISIQTGTTSAVQGRFGIYTDNGSYAPGNLVIQTDPVYLTAKSWNTIPLPAPVYLTAATYWLVSNFPTSSFGDLVAISGGNLTYVNYSWGQMPLTFPTTGVNTIGYLAPGYFSTCP
jgi:hypothetical protein